MNDAIRTTVEIEQQVARLKNAVDRFSREVSAWRTAGLPDKTIIVLLSKSTGLPQKTVHQVLEGLDSFYDDWLNEAGDAE